MELNQDLITIIMLELPLEDVQSLILTDKLGASIDKNIFWKQKFIKDFNNVQVISNNWKNEYYKMYQALITATKFVQMLELLVMTKTIVDFYIPMNINLKNINLPSNMKNALAKNIDHDPLQFGITFDMKYFIFLDYDLNGQFIRFLEDIDKLKFINIISEFLYHNPTIKFNTDMGSTLLYKDLINKPNLSSYEQNILFIWNQI